MRSAKETKFAVIVGVSAAVAAGFALSKLFLSGQTNFLNPGGCAPTFPEGWYLLSADQIEAATFDIGTDEASIYRVFGQLQKDCDYVRLFNAYGVRRYFSFSTLYVNYNLPQVLQAELSTGELNEVNEILAENGLTYRV